MPPPTRAESFRAIRSSAATLSRTREQVQKYRCSYPFPHSPEIRQKLAAISEGVPSRHKIGDLLCGDLVASNRTDHTASFHDHNAVADSVHVPDVVIDYDH